MTPTLTFRNLKRETLTQDCASLHKQYAAVSKKKRLETNPSTRSTLEDQLTELESEINMVEEDLYKLDQGVQSSVESEVDGLTIRRQDNMLKSRLSEIDFNDAKEIFYRVLLHHNRHKRKRAALFLLHNNSDMQGELCLSILRHKLQARTRVFRHFPIEFGLTTPFNERAFLDKIAEYFRVKPEANLDAYAQTVIDTICNALTRDSVFFFEFNLLDDPFSQEQFPKWLLHLFWKPLIRKINEIAKDKPKAKIVCAVVIEQIVDKGNFATDFFCQELLDDVRKIIPIPLSLWDAEDIRDWLFSLELDQLTIEQIEELSRSVHDLSKSGLPCKVADILLKDPLIRKGL